MTYRISDRRAYLRIKVCNVRPDMGDAEPTVATVKAKMEAEYGGIWHVSECYGNKREFFHGYDWTCDATKVA